MHAFIHQPITYLREGEGRVQIGEGDRKVLVVGTSSAWDSWKESDVRQCSGNDLSAKSHMNGTNKPEILRQTVRENISSAHTLSFHLFSFNFYHQLKVEQGGQNISQPPTNDW